MMKTQKKLQRVIKAEYNRIRQLLTVDPQMKFALMLENYGPFKRHTSYQIKGEGRDWVRMSSRGKIYYVGKHLIHPDPFSYLLGQDDLLTEDEEDDWQMDDDLIFKY